MSKKKKKGNKMSNNKQDDLNGASGYSTGYSGFDAKVISAQERFNKNVEDMDTSTETNKTKTMLEKESNAKEGTPEYEAYRKLVENVQTTNSTTGINELNWYLKKMGGIASVVVIFIAFFGIAYDTDFHAPVLHETVKDFPFYILVLFATFIIFVLGHKTADGLVNNKYKKNSKTLVLALFAIGVIAGLYFEYRAIVNLTENRLDANIQKQLKVGTTSKSSTPKSIQDSLASKKDELAIAKIDKKETEKALKELEAQSKELTNKTLTDEYIKSHWRNKKRVTKQIKTVSEKIKVKEQKIKDLKAVIKALPNEIIKKSEEFAKAMEPLDDAKKEQLQSSLIYLFVFAFVLKLASYGDIIASAIANANVTKESRADIHEVDTINAQHRAYNNHVNALKASALKDMNNGLAINRATLSAINNHAMVSGMESVNMMKQTTDTIQSVTSGTTYLAEMAGEGLGHAVNAKLGEKQVESLKKELLTIAGKIGNQNDN